jgi:hypothetical protein
MMLGSPLVRTGPLRYDGAFMVSGRLGARCTAYQATAQQCPLQRSPDMARKILNRKELRQETEAAERVEAEDKKPAKKPAKKKPAKRKTRSKTAAEVRLKAFWGVFNQSLKRVALFEYSERKQADKKAKQLSESANTPHFVQLVKEVIEE